MSAEATVARADPIAPADALALQRAFEAIHLTRMAGLDFLNPRLRVTALGFQDWRGLRVGALITPWSINLVLLSGASASLPAIRRGDPHPWAFPSGVYGFLAHEEPGVGCYHQCSLFSPVTEFVTQADAEQAALAALEALMQPPTPIAATLPARLSRRGLLTGA